MNIHTFCEGIQLDSEARQLVESYQMKEAEYQAYKRLFYADRKSFYEQVKRNEPYRLLFLYLYVRLAIDAYEAYEARGISQDIYFATFHDIQIWCAVCKKSYGEYGLEEYQWLQEHIRLQLFRLGRLQFQPYTFSRENNQTVLNVHIPEGDPLHPDLVQDSYAQAKAFFKDIPPMFICSSWLLYPGLHDILPASSNILAFQSDYELYEIHHEARQAEERIFGKLCDDPADYEEQTSLQRRAKSYLLAGHKLGNGSGIFRMSTV